MSKAIYKMITKDIASDWTDDSIKAKFQANEGHFYATGVNLVKIIASQADRTSLVDLSCHTFKNMKTGEEDNIFQVTYVGQFQHHELESLWKMYEDMFVQMT